MDKVLLWLVKDGKVWELEEDSDFGPEPFTSALGWRGGLRCWRSSRSFVRLPGGSDVLDAPGVVTCSEAIELVRKFAPHFRYAVYDSVTFSEWTVAEGGTMMSRRRTDAGPGEAYVVPAPHPEAEGQWSVRPGAGNGPMLTGSCSSLYDGMEKADKAIVDNYPWVTLLGGPYTIRRDVERVEARDIAAAADAVVAAMADVASRSERLAKAIGDNSDVAPEQVLHDVLAAERHAVSGKLVAAAWTPSGVADGSQIRRRQNSSMLASRVYPNGSWIVWGNGRDNLTRGQAKTVDMGKAEADAACMSLSIELEGGAFVVPPATPIVPEVTQHSVPDGHGGWKELAATEAEWAEALRVVRDFIGGNGPLAELKRRVEALESRRPMLPDDRAPIIMLDKGEPDAAPKRPSIEVVPDGDGFAVRLAGCGTGGAWTPGYAWVTASMEYGITASQYFDKRARWFSRSDAALRANMWCDFFGLPRVK